MTLAESSESDPPPPAAPPPPAPPAPLDRPPWAPGRFEREKALLNELRSQDFFFSCGEGDSPIPSQPPPALPTMTPAELAGIAWDGGDADETELKFVTWLIKYNSEFP